MSTITSPRVSRVEYTELDSDSQSLFLIHFCGFEHTDALLVSGRARYNADDDLWYVDDAEMRLEVLHVKSRKSFCHQDERFWLTANLVTHLNISKKDRGRTLEDVIDAVCGMAEYKANALFELGKPYRAHWER